MKVHLLHESSDPQTDAELPEDSDALVRDLGLDIIFDQMAQGDQFLRDVARQTVLATVTEPAEILWRQGVLQDCLDHEEAVRELYDLATEAITSRKKVRGWFLGEYPEAILGRSIEILEALMGDLQQLQRFADLHAGDFRSPGMRGLVSGIAQDLSEDYFLVLDDHLRRLRFRSGVVLTAALGDRGKGRDYVLKKPRSIKRTWRDFLRLPNQGALVYQVPDRDEAGGRALAELRSRGVNLVADALGQSTDHVLSFFTLLRWELAFYLGALNLHHQLTSTGLPAALPEPEEAVTTDDGLQLTVHGLYDVGLALRLRGDVVTNDLDSDGKPLVMITGANQGGKSTLLRSLGLAQLMMQSGMFVAAEGYRASVATTIHTHYRREEDTSMVSGKLDEELARMSHIVDRTRPGGLVLFNESFACTNEREGSQIARTIVDGLVDAGVRVVYVTHMYDLAHSLQQRSTDGALFLRPERLPDGHRTFRVTEGLPQPSSYGKDLYDKVFATTPGSTD